MRFTRGTLSQAIGVCALSRIHTHDDGSNNAAYCVNLRYFRDWVSIQEGTYIIYAPTRVYT